MNTKNIPALSRILRGTAAATLALALSAGVQAGTSFPAKVQQELAREQREAREAREREQREQNRRDEARRDYRGDNDRDRREQRDRDDGRSHWRGDRDDRRDGNDDHRHDGRHDGRYDNRGRVYDPPRYYYDNRYDSRPPRIVKRIPPGHARYFWQNSPYYYQGGNWYRPWGSGFAVVGAPYGMFVPQLPGAHTSYWSGNDRYFRVGDTWFRFDNGRRGYVVSPSPWGR